MNSTSNDLKTKHLNQFYNKVITINIPKDQENDKFDIIYQVYHGKITTIADHFNFKKLSVEKIEEIVKNASDEKTNMNVLHISSFLSFTNIFMYMLTFKADLFHLDVNNRNFMHIIAYKGEVRLLLLLINWLRFNHKMLSIKTVDQISTSHGFSKLDIVKGKLSKGVNKTETNLKRFKDLQEKLKQEAIQLIIRNLQVLEALISKQDVEGRNILHYAAMSKYSLCYQIIFTLVDYEFFKLDGWEDFLQVHSDTQDLEIKPERLLDPRKCLRIEKVLENLLGDNIIKELKAEFTKGKSEILIRNINNGDNNGDTVMHVAAFHGDFRIVNKLLNAGGNKLLKNNDGKLPVDLAKDDYVRKVLTSLNKAAKNSDSKSITELVNFGHNINDKESIFSQAPIHKIIESQKTDKYDVLKKILDMGADPSIKDSNGWTALHYSCQFGDFQATDILVKSGAKIDSYSNNNRTPLHLAATSNFPDIVKYLLINRADPNYKDSLGCTPLHLASKHGNVECIDLLLSFRADLYAEDFRKWNILHYASFHGHKAAVKYISKYDADLNHLQNCRNSQNKLPIEIVMTPSVKPYFISLWQAAKDGDLDMMRNCINDGENVNEQTTFLKNTALHLATLNNHYLAVRLLLEIGSDPSISNKDGLTSVDYADILNNVITKNYSSEKDNNILNLRDYVRNIFNKNEKTLEATITEKSTKVRLWNVQDFSNKIIKILNVKK